MKKRGSALVWILVIAIIIVIIVIAVLLFVFKSSDSSSNTVADNNGGSLSAVSGFTKVNAGDVEFLKPKGWSSNDNFKNNSALYFKPGYTKDPENNPISALGLDKNNGQVILYKYKTIMPIRPSRLEQFKDKDYRYPKTATMCDDLPFYFYGAEISNVEKSGYVKEYPYAEGTELFTVTYANLLSDQELTERYGEHDKDEADIRFMCKFISKMDEENNKLELYTIFYMAREEALDEDILNTLLNIDFF